MIYLRTTKRIKIHNITIQIRYHQNKNDHGTRWLMSGNIENLYYVCHREPEIIYFKDGNGTHMFTNVTELKKTVEETIHQCLPDPYSCLQNSYKDKGFAWKHCLYDLVENDFNEA